MKTELLSFTTEWISEAGKLLAKRHQRNHRRLPLLPARFEDPQVAAKAVEALWQNKLKSGYAAVRNGQLIAYLLGENVVQPWGRSGYVYLPGYALAEGESVAILQDLYTLLGEEWVRKGYFGHGLYICAADEDIIQGLFDMGFGKQRVDALLDLRTIEIPHIEEPSGITIRRAGTGDNEHLGNLSDIIFRALANPPYWHPTVPEDWEELREGWSELADDKEWTVWLALARPSVQRSGEQEQALTTIGFTRQNEADTDLLASPNTVYLSVAATRPQARGRGINTALTWHGLEQARQAGYEICYTNWISPNFLASRFWPRFGFKDVAYRLSKNINPMISWARKDISR